MKKKNLFLFIATALLLSVSVFAASKGSWYVVSDSCGKCQVNYIDRVCGKCEGFLQQEGKSKVEGKCQVNYIDRVCGKCEGFLQQEGKSKVEGKYLVSTFKCKKCSHTCVFKVKY